GTRALPASGPADPETTGCKTAALLGRWSAPRTSPIGENDGHHPPERLGTAFRRGELPFDRARRSWQLAARFLGPLWCGGSPACRSKPGERSASAPIAVPASMT